MKAKSLNETLSSLQTARALPGGAYTRGPCVMRRLATDRPLSGRPALGPDFLALADSFSALREPDALFGQFADEAGAMLGAQHVHYANEAAGLSLSFGQVGRHTCLYHLAMSHEELGRVSLTRERPFRERELAQLEKLLRVLLAPLAAALRYRAALLAGYTDPVTRVSNRAALDSALERELPLARRHGAPMALMMLDIDHFKRVNDRYGHMAGDAVLRGIAECLRSCCRCSDMVFRYGGEEFAILLSNTDLEGARQLAERIREQASQMTHRIGKRTVRVSLSVGVSEGQERDDPARLLARVDRALYAAKRGGRNRVESR